MEYLQRFSVIDVIKMTKVSVLTHANNITSNIVTKGKISSNSYQNVYRAGRTDTGANNICCSMSKF